MGCFLPHCAIPSPETRHTTERCVTGNGAQHLRPQNQAAPYGRRAEAALLCHRNAFLGEGLGRSCAALPCSLSLTNLGSCTSRLCMSESCREEQGSSQHFKGVIDE